MALYLGDFTINSPCGTIDDATFQCLFRFSCEWHRADHEHPAEYAEVSGKVESLTIGDLELTRSMLTLMIGEDELDRQEGFIKAQIAEELEASHNTCAHAEHRADDTRALIAAE